MRSSREETSSSSVVTEATTVTTSKADAAGEVDSVVDGVVRARRVGREGVVRSRFVEWSSREATVYSDNHRGCGEDQDRKL